MEAEVHEKTQLLLQLQFENKELQSRRRALETAIDASQDALDVLNLLGAINISSTASAAAAAGAGGTASAAADAPAAAAAANGGATAGGVAATANVPAAATGGTGAEGGIGLTRAGSDTDVEMACADNMEVEQGEAGAAAARASCPTAAAVPGAGVQSVIGVPPSGHAAAKAVPAAVAARTGAGAMLPAGVAVAGDSRPSSSTGFSPSTSSGLGKSMGAAAGEDGGESRRPAAAAAQATGCSRAGSAMTNTDDSCGSRSAAPTGAARTGRAMAAAPAAAAEVPSMQEGSPGGLEQSGGLLLSDSKQVEQDALRAAGYVSDWESSLVAYKEFVVHVATLLQRAEGAVPGAGEEVEAGGGCQAGWRWNNKQLTIDAARKLLILFICPFGCGNNGFPLVDKGW